MCRALNPVHVCDLSFRICTSPNLDFFVRFFSDLKSEEEEETDFFLKECAGDPALRERISILSRTFLNRSRMAQDDKMLLSDDTLSIEPLVSGRIGLQR